MTGRAVQRRRIALLALLALARNRGLTRERLVGYLWPDSDPERARRLLSDSVYRINQAMGEEVLVAAGDELRLDGDTLLSDASEFCDAIDREDWKRAVQLQPAPLLDGFYVSDAPDFERWVDSQRERLSRDKARALEALAEADEREGRTRQAIGWLRALSDEDPYNSRIALRLMRALDRNGERAAALRHARHHTVVLEDEIGVSPDPQLAEFAEALSRPGSNEAKRTLAVLPFSSLGEVTEDDYFADGVTEDLIGHLARIGALSVISRKSAMRFKDSAASNAEIGRALGATSLVTGSVRRLGDRVRVTVQLIDALTDHVVWAETYARELTDVFEIQSDVALQIATMLRTRLSSDERTRIGKHPTRNAEAYQLFLQGRHCFVRFTSASMRQGIHYFERALELDAGYALAHANIAMACAELGEQGTVDSKEAYHRARVAAQAAISLDESLAEAHCIMGHLKAACDFDWPGAEREFKRALELSPSSADTYDLYGRMCAGVGRHEEGVTMQRRALELDPLAHRVDYATALLRAGRHDEALTAAQSAVEFDPQYAYARGALAWALLLSGRPTEGIAELEKAVSLAPENTAWYAQLGQAYACVGRTNDALQVLDRLERRSEMEYVSPYHIAYVLTGLGRHDRAVEALERAHEQRAGAVYGIKGSFLFAPLRGHPRFTVLLRRMNLA